MTFGFNFSLQLREEFVVFHSFTALGLFEAYFNSSHYAKVIHDTIIRDVIRQLLDHLLNLLFPRHSASSSAANAVVFEREFVILAQGVPDPVLRQEDTGQIGVPGEPNTGQVVHFALVPVGRRPQ